MWPKQERLVLVRLVKTSIGIGFRETKTSFQSLRKVLIDKPIIIFLTRSKRGQIFKSSRSQMFFKIAVFLWNLQKFSEKEFANITNKVGLSPSKKICVISLMESPLKMIRNTFYFILKGLFVLKIFKFLSWLFGHVEKAAWLER